MSVMSRTHFRLVANAIRFVRLHYYAHSSTDALYQLARVLSDQFSSNNPRFDDDLWMKACGWGVDSEDPFDSDVWEEWKEEHGVIRQQRAKETQT